MSAEQIASELDELSKCEVIGAWYDDITSAAKLLRAQAERVKVLESALRFYANEENYDDNGAPESGGVKAPTWSRHDFDLIQSELDRGKIARAALPGEA